MVAVSRTVVFHTLAAVLAAVALVLSFPPLLGKFNTLSEQNIVNFEHLVLDVKEREAKSKLSLQPEGSIKQALKLITGYDLTIQAQSQGSKSALLTAGNDEATQEFVVGLTKFAVEVTGFPADSTTVRGVVSTYNLYMGTLLKGDDFLADWSQTNQDKFGLIFEAAINRTRGAVAMALLAIVGFHLALGMLLSGNNTLVVPALLSVSSVASLIFMVMIQLVSNETSKASDLAFELEPTRGESPEPEAGPAVFTAGFAMACGIFAVVFSALSMKFGRKSHTSEKDMEMEEDEEEE